MSYSRSLVYSIAGGTASQTIQIPQNATIVGALFSVVTAAAGSWELSTNGTSQIATTNPDVGVKARVRIGATAGNLCTYVPIGAKVKTLDNWYLHCTGAGNVGEL